jgi:hypothetical protein
LAIKAKTAEIYANITAWKIWQGSNPLGWITALIGVIIGATAALSAWNEHLKE